MSQAPTGRRPVPGAMPGLAPSAAQALALPRFAALGAPYVQPVQVQPLAQAQLLNFNTALAADIGLPPQWRDSPHALALLAESALRAAQPPGASRD